MLGELASYVTSLIFLGALVADMAMSNLDSPMFEKPKEPTVNYLSEYEETIIAFFEREEEWDARVCERKENYIVIHSFFY